MTRVMQWEGRRLLLAGGASGGTDEEDQQGLEARQQLSGLRQHYQQLRGRQPGQRQVWPHGLHRFHRLLRRAQPPQEPAHGNQYGL